MQGSHQRGQHKEAYSQLSNLAKTPLEAAWSGIVTFKCGARLEEKHIGPVAREAGEARETYLRR